MIKLKQPKLIRLIWLVPVIAMLAWMTFQVVKIFLYILMVITASEWSMTPHSDFEYIGMFLAYAVVLAALEVVP